MNSPNLVSGLQLAASGSHASLASTTFTTPNRAETKTVFLVDSRLADFSEQVVDRHNGDQVIYLSRKQVGLEQATAALLNCTNIVSLHILALSRPGAVLIGSHWLNLEALEAHSQLIATWKQVLAPTATLVLHSCNVAMSTEGMTFLGRLSQLTGALVTAVPPVETDSLTIDCSIF